MKRIISFSLALMYVTLLFGGVSAAEQEVGYSEPIALVSALGMMDASQEQAQDTVTRAEFAEIMTRVMGASELPDSGRRIFADVLPEHSASASIEYLYDRNIMRGYGGAEFKPDNTITVGEAVKVAVSVIGYSQMAENDGGWLTGYYSAASGSGLLRGISADGKTPITVADTAKLIQNILENNDMLIIKGFKNGEPIVEKAEGKLYMEDVLGIYKYRGIVEACGYTSLSGENGSNENVCTISGEKFYTGDVAVSDYLGMKVDAYYRYDDRDLSTIVYMKTNQSTQTVEVNADDVSDATTKESFVYFEDDKDETITISESAIFIYNGKRLDVAADADLIPKTGSVRLISNDGDDSYDVVIIKDYDTFVASKVLAQDFKIDFKYDRGTMDLSRQNGIRAKYFLDGEETDFSSIVPGSVLSIAISKNVSGDRLAEVLISNNQVTAVVAGISGDGNDKMVETGEGDEYFFNEEYLRRLNENQPNTYAPEPGKEGVLYIDYFGKLAAYAVSTASKNYAYVIAADYEAFADKVKLKLFTKDSTIEIYEAGDKVKMNGERVKQSEIIDRLKLSGENNTVNQLIICDINSDSKITEIKTAENKTQEVTGEPYYIASEDEFVLNAHPVSVKDNGDIVARNVRFYKNMAEHLPFTYVNNQTLQFMVPTDKSKEKDYKIATKLSGTDVSVPGPIYIYDAGASGCIGAMVTNTASEGSYSDSCVIDRTFKTVDEEGSVCSGFEFAGGTRAVVSESAEMESFKWSDTDFTDYQTVAVSDLKRGDVIQYTTSNGMIDKIRLIVKGDNVGPVRMDGEYIQRSGNMVADVISVAENGRTALVYYCGIGAQGKKEYRYQTMLVNGSVYRYESAEDKVYLSSTADLRPGDRVVINSFWWSPKSVVIFR